MGILDTPPGFITQGEVQYRGVDLLKLPENERRKVRANQIAMIFQDALSALNPVFTVGYQLAELFRVHRGHVPRRRQEARDRAARPGQDPGRAGPDRATTRTSSPAACASA